MMKKTNNNLNCSDIEDLIIRRDLNEVTDSESKLLNEHVKSCQKCNAFQNTVSKIKNNMTVPSHSGLIPAPEIYHIAVSKMKKKKQNRPHTEGGVREFILGILKYRIPVYQAAMGIVLFIFLTLTANQFNFSGNLSGGKISETLYSEEGMIDTVDVLKDFFNIDKQKIGRNAKEDSFFTQFMFTIM